MLLCRQHTHEHMVHVYTDASCVLIRYVLRYQERSAYVSGSPGSARRILSRRYQERSAYVSGSPGSARRILSRRKTHQHVYGLEENRAPGQSCLRSSILAADTADLGTLDAFLSKDQCAWRGSVEYGLTSSAIAFGAYLQFQP